MASKRRKTEAQQGKNESFENVLARLCREIERSHDLSREIASLRQKKRSAVSGSSEDLAAETLDTNETAASE